MRIGLVGEGLSVSGYETRVNNVQGLSSEDLQLHGSGAEALSSVLYMGYVRTVFGAMEWLIGRTFLAWENRGMSDTAPSAEGRLDAARAGSVDALGQLLEACRAYLLLIAEHELHHSLQAKGGASDL